MDHHVVQQSEAIVICSSENFSPQVGVEGEEELVAVLEFYTGLGLIAYWGRFFENES